MREGTQAALRAGVQELSPDPMRALMKKVQANDDSQAFDGLRPHIARLIAAQFRERTNAHELDEVILTTLEKVWAARRQWRGGPVSGWVRRIAHNVWADLIEESEKDRVVTPVEPSKLADLIAQPTRAKSSTGVARLCEILEELTEAQRLVTLLHPLGGFSFVRIAQLLGGTDNKWRQIWFKARRQVARVCCDLENAYEGEVE